ncbi:formate/nitrite transporter family protein [Nisaea sp.]|uniref:formate/nitrite transporter family protein n=1 Tax=Nisaea sp. TaxID=2024842 RepID=UPI0032EB2F5D
MKSKSDSAERVDEHRPLTSGETFKVVSESGLEELRRPAVSLAWSGLAAGLALGFSVVAEAVLAGHLPGDADWAPLVGNMGYTVGFIIVVLGRLQLFTENTITPVLPICKEPTRKNLLALTRNWSVVLAANLVGASLFAAFVMLTPALPETARGEILELGRHVAHDGFVVTAVKGIGAGFLIASMVWALANMRSGQLLAIFIVTYIVALCGFAHVVAGTVEIAALVLTGGLAIGPAIFGFIIPALIGNIIGGTVLFGFISYAQVSREVE